MMTASLLWHGFLTDITERKQIEADRDFRATSWRLFTNCQRNRGDYQLRRANVSGAFEIVPLQSERY